MHPILSAYFLSMTLLCRYVICFFLAGLLSFMCLIVILFFDSSRWLDWIEEKIQHAREHGLKGHGAMNSLAFIYYFVSEECYVTTYMTYFAYAGSGST